MVKDCMGTYKIDYQKYFVPNFTQHIRFPDLSNTTQPIITIFLDLVKALQALAFFCYHYL